MENSVRLRPVRVGDEAVVRLAHELLKADNFTFALYGFSENVEFSRYVDALTSMARGLDLPESTVPGTFLVAEVNGEVVGRVSIRHELNDQLRRDGGHIGYCVLPAHRGRGYASEMLRQSLIIARSLGVDVPLLFCDEINSASARVIERNGGVLEWTGLAEPGRAIRRYRIE